MPGTTAEENRGLLVRAQAQGGWARWSAYARLSGPGWLQSAITLGGGSLAGALFLGILGGTQLLWLQLVAITMGVIMLSAISYVTLTTGQRPFQAINQHINPALGWGWLVATCLANMIWCMPQFGLCYAALQENLLPNQVGSDLSGKIGVSAWLLSAAGLAVWLNSQGRIAARLFDWFLKALVATIVICFFGVVLHLSWDGQLDWARILSGFIPSLRSWTEPAGDVAQLVAALDDQRRAFWTDRLVREQRAVMIGAAATAVGINMTFLMPYAMLNRGWDKPFRGFARFDLATGMAIPYVLVTSCVVIAAAATFHGQVDSAFLSPDPDEMARSPLYQGATQVLQQRAALTMGAESFGQLSAAEQRARVAALPESEKRIASALVRRDAFQLSQSLAPLLGERRANLVFGIGVFGMGFSTIMILMLINGYAFCEMLGKPQGGWPHLLGCAVAGLSGAVWPLVWDGPAKLWLAILASSFGMMLLPIAYATFFMMMNSRSLLGAERPAGLRRGVWNVLMLVSVLGALIAAGTAIWDKATDTTPLVEGWPISTGHLVIGLGLAYLLLVVWGFVGGWRAQPTRAPASD